MLCLGVVGCSGYYLWSSGWLDQASGRALNTVYESASNAGFVVKDIVVEGRIHAERDALKELIGVEKGQSIFENNLSEIRARIETISWVKQARVERRLPDVLYINIQERVPLALWQKNGKLSLVDSEGVILTNKDLQRFSHLLIIVGDEAPQKAGDLVVMIAAEPLIKERIEAAKWIGNRRWDLIMRSGLTIRLPEEDAGLAMRRLAEAQEAESIMDRKIDSIDLRDETRIVLQALPGAVQEYKASFHPEKSEKGI